MSDSTDVAAEINAIFARDAALYEVISKHIRPVVWAISPEEGAVLGERLAKMFPSLPGPMRPLRFVEQPSPDAAADEHAPLFRAINRTQR